VRYALSLPVLGLFVSFAAAAAPAPGTIMKATPPQPQQKRIAPKEMCHRIFEMKVARIGQMATAMKLTDAQKPLFEAWRKVRLEVDGGWPCPLPAIGTDVPTPKRLDSQILVLRYEVESLEKEKPAAVALYDTLTPDQRAIFDNPASLAQPPAPAQDAPQTAPAAKSPAPESH
jgi:hypothetical protein